MICRTVIGDNIDWLLKIKVLLGTWYFSWIRILKEKVIYHLYLLILSKVMLVLPAMQVPITAGWTEGHQKSQSQTWIPTGDLRSAAVSYMTVRILRPSIYRVLWQNERTYYWYSDMKCHCSFVALRMLARDVPLHLKFWTKAIQSFQKMPAYQI